MRPPLVGIAVVAVVAVVAALSAWRSERPAPAVLVELPLKYFEFTVHEGARYRETEIQGSQVIVQRDLVELEEPLMRHALTLLDAKLAEVTASEAYLGTNDFFPFTREELEKYDPVGYEMVSAAWR